MLDDGSESCEDIQSTASDVSVQGLLLAFTDVKVAGEVAKDFSLKFGVTKEWLEPRAYGTVDFVPGCRL